MKVIVLASGSKGNATYIETSDSNILIDCGISRRQLITRMAKNNLNFNSIDKILVTHEHNDHVSGLRVLLSKINPQIYMTKLSYNHLHFKTKDNINKDNIVFIKPYESFFIGSLLIYPFSVSHDSNDAIGFKITEQEKTIVYLTDSGYIPKKDFAFLKNADVYIFESNYDVTMLFKSKRPYYLKQRIDSVKGHMSNSDSAYNLTQLIGEKTKQIILAHPSRECNTPEKALDTHIEIYKEYEISADELEIIVASQDFPTKLIEF
ncbi:MAG: MBL fold metallo-hydrolase [Candidatus Izimaplasma sp.]|nr:MBL fold metallo-hydrolase [Candidatus Izimaplasma bacterium]